MENQNNETRCPRCMNLIYSARCPYCGTYAASQYNPVQGQNASQGYSQTQQGIYNSVPSPNGYYRLPNGELYPIKKNKTGLIVGLSIAGAVLLIAIFISLSYVTYALVSENTERINDFSTDSRVNTESSQQSAYPNGISDEEFEKLEIGMSYAHASSIIGGDGILVSAGEDLYGKAYQVYVWVFENDDSEGVYITFSKDEITDISVESLY